MKNFLIWLIGTIILAWAAFATQTFLGHVTTLIVGVPWLIVTAMLFISWFGENPGTSQGPPSPRGRSRP